LSFSLPLIVTKDIERNALLPRSEVPEGGGALHIRPAHAERVPRLRTHKRGNPDAPSGARRRHLSPCTLHEPSGATALRHQRLASSTLDIFKTFFVGSLLKLVSIPCCTSALVRQCGGLGNSVESLNISYGKPRYRVELFGKLLDGPGLIRIKLEVGSA
jgi:hypothetical protein